MSAPDFTGLTGKELVHAHRAWRREQMKQLVPAEKTRFAGLTQAQAIEVHTAESRRMAAGMGVAVLLMVAIYIGGNVLGTSTSAFMAEAGFPTAIRVIACVGELAFAVGLGGWIIFELFSVRNPVAARQSYIRAIDERVEDARKRSGIFPILIMSLVEVYLGVVMVNLAALPPEPGMTPNEWLVGALVALIVLGCLQPIIAGAVYLLLRGRA